MTAISAIRYTRITSTSGTTGEMTAPNSSLARADKSASVSRGGGPTAPQRFATKNGIRLQPRGGVFALRGDGAPPHTIRYRRHVAAATGDWGERGRFARRGGRVNMEILRVRFWLVAAPAAYVAFRLASRDLSTTCDLEGQPPVEYAIRYVGCLDRHNAAIGIAVLAAGLLYGSLLAGWNKNGPPEWAIDWASLGIAIPAAALAGWVSFQILIVKALEYLWGVPWGDQKALASISGVANLLWVVWVLIGGAICLAAAFGGGYFAHEGAGGLLRTKLIGSVGTTLLVGPTIGLCLAIFVVALYYIMIFLLVALTVWLVIGIVTTTTVIIVVVL